MPGELQKEVPEWAGKFIQKWAEKLNIEHWIIKGKVEMCLNGNPEAWANCEQQYLINEATIGMRADIEETDEWKVYLIHELLHVAHAHIDFIVEDVVISELPEACKRMGRESYTNAYEPFIQRMAVSLLRMDEPHVESEETASES